MELMLIVMATLTTHWRRRHLLMMMMISRLSGVIARLGRYAVRAAGRLKGGKIESILGQSGASQILESVNDLNF